MSTVVRWGLILLGAVGFACFVGAVWAVLDVALMSRVLEHRDE